MLSSEGIILLKFIISPSASSVEVCSPHLIVKKYFLALVFIKGINFVVLLIAIGRIPSAFGSKVPACLIFFMLNFFLIL